jgi:hypothetical protein
MRTVSMLLAGLLVGLLACANLHCDGDDPATPSPDRTPPAEVSDLDRVSGSETDSSLTLAWTAPGDDGHTGRAALYDLRWSRNMITSDADWAGATPASNPPTPQPAGSTEFFTVSGLAEEQTYYFALKSEDEAGNRSGLSNVTSGTTLAEAFSAIVRPDGTGDFTTIQAAIEGTLDGAIIFVDEGTYEEGLVIEGRSVTLIGAGPAVCRVTHHTLAGGIARVLDIDGCPSVSIHGIHFAEQMTDCDQGVAVKHSSAVFSECIFDSCGLLANASDIRMERCTVYADWASMCDSQHTGLVYLLDSHAELSETIIFLGRRGGIECVGGSTVSVRCCDVWQNPDPTMNYVNCPDLTGIDSNISADPKILDAPGDDFHLHASSPCLVGSSPQCGRMGALGLR